MSTITRERIENLIEFNSEGSDCQANAEQWEVHELSRIALASLEAEAVACPKCNGTGMADSGGVQPWGEPISVPCDCTDQVSLVHVPDEKVKGNDFELDGPLSCYQAGKIDGWNACRAAMLQGGKS